MSKDYYLFKELKALTNNLQDFSNVDLEKINPQHIKHIKCQNTLNRWCIWKFEKHHGKDKYNYNEIEYVNSYTKVKIKHNKCGNFFWQAPIHHQVGDGCPCCFGYKAYKGETHTFKQKSVNKHGDFFNYEKSIYVNKNTKVEIICPIHGPFWQLPSDHIRYGCKKCGFESNKKKQRKTNSQFIEQSQETHGKDEYDYNESKYINDNTKVKIKHNKCGKCFWQDPYQHISGQGCPYCKQSKGELQISKILQQNRIKFKEQHHFNKHKDLKNKSSYMAFDFYLPDYNLCIEYDGIQHFEAVEIYGGGNGLKDIQRRDSIKDHFCLNHNIKLLRIPHWVKLTEELVLSHISRDFTVVSVTNKAKKAH